jgi:hypothetical protein
MTLIKPFAYWEQRDSAVIPPAAQSLYLAGYNFYKFKGTRLGQAVQGGVAKISLDGTLDTTWTTNANPTNSNQVRFFVPLNGNIYADYRIPNSSTRAVRKLDSTGTSVASVPTTGGSIWNMHAREGSNFFIITGDNTLTYNGTSVRGIGKINEDLTRDTTWTTNVSTGPNGFVEKPFVSADRVGVTGQFTSWNSNTAYSRFVVLNYDGTVDTSFAKTGTFNGTRTYTCIYIDGKWIVGGDFTTYGGGTYNRIIAFNPDGSLNTTFNTNIGSGFAGGSIYGFLKISETQILVTGNFSSLNGVTMNRAAIINVDGTIPTNVFGTGFNGWNMGYADVDTSGNLYFAGAAQFTTYNTTNATNNIISLLPNGNVNNTFATGSGMQTSSTTTSEAGGLFIR